MECPQCLLRFTLHDRYPLIQNCGHTICKNCISKLNCCPTCGSEILSSKDNDKPNYSLLEMIEKDTRQIDKFIKVCFVGSSGVGKTSLIRMLGNKDFTEDVATTVGYDFMYIDRQISQHQIRFQLWDSAGQERYRAISPIHYKNSNIIVIVYNVCGDSQSNQVMNWIGEAEKHAPEDAEVILIGNKIDMTENKMFQPLNKEAWEFIQKEKVNRVETSCKTKAGLEQFWALLEESFIQRRNMRKISPVRSPKKCSASNNQMKPFETSVGLKNNINRSKQAKKQSSNVCC